MSEYDEAEERSRARRAQQAWIGYVEEFVRTQREALLLEFLNASVSNKAALISVKLKLDALASLEAAIQSDIDSGTVLAPREETNG